MQQARRSMASDRSAIVSFALGLQGPCATIDTACSSALVSLNVALLSLRKGDSNAAMASGRLSFALGLQGPCATIDTACSSALVLLNVALLSLRKGDSNAAMSVLRLRGRGAEGTKEDPTEGMGFK